MYVIKRANVGTDRNDCNQSTFSWEDGGLNFWSSVLGRAKIKCYFERLYYIHYLY